MSDIDLRRYQRELERTGRKVLVVDRSDTRVGWVMRHTKQGSYICSTFARDKQACELLFRRASWASTDVPREEFAPARVRIWEEKGNE